MKRQPLRSAGKLAGFVFAVVVSAGALATPISLGHQWTDGQGKPAHFTFSLSEDRVVAGLTEAGDFYNIDVIFNRIMQHASQLAEDLSSDTVKLSIRVYDMSYVIDVYAIKEHRALATQLRNQIELYINDSFEDLAEVSYYRRLSPSRIFIDYNQVIDDFEDIIQLTHDYFRQKTDNLSEDEQINERLRFLQSITYDDLLSNDFELMTPLRMLAEGRGDCESKQLYFAGLLKKEWPDRKVFLVTLYDKQHIVTALEMPSRSQHGLVRYEGRSFLILDATGPSFTQATDSEYVIGHFGVDGVNEHWQEIGPTWHQKNNNKGSF